jgi:hypothetical protein
MFRTKRAPFGIVGANGLNFARSVGKPDSNLEQVLAYLGRCGTHRGTVVTKKDILRDVFHRPNAKSSWASTFWRILHASGLVVRTGRGMSATYSLPTVTRISDHT